LEVPKEHSGNNHFKPEQNPPLSLEIYYGHGSEIWIVRKIGAPAEIAEFIQLQIPKSPDPKIEEMLDELNAKIPPGVP
jgi:hypothetical protein